MTGPDGPGPIPDVSALSPAKRALFERLRHRTDAVTALPSGPELSFAQQRMWVMEQVAPDQVHHTVRAVALRGPLDIAAMGAALGGVVDRHEALRTGVAVRDGEPTALLLTPPAQLLDVIDAAPGAPLEPLLTAFSRQPFDLTHEVPVRARLWRRGRGDHVLAVVVHHLASDEGSRAVFWRDLAAGYAACVASSSGGPPASASARPAPVPYRDFAAAQRQGLATHGADEVGFWTARLRGLPRLSTFPPTRRLVDTGAVPSGRRRVRIDASITAGLRSVARQERATTFMAALAAYAWIMRQWTGETDLVFGMPVSGRGDPRFDETIGLFVNTVVVHVDAAGDPSFRTLVGRVRSAVIEALEHQEIPFERVVEAFTTERVPGRHPLFQVLVNGTRDAGAAPEFAGLTATLVDTDSGAIDVDSGVLFAENGDDLDVLVGYRADLYDAATARLLLDQFTAVAARVVEDPDRPLGTDDLLTSADRAGQAAANATTAPRPGGTVVDLFLDQAARTPHAPAIADDTHDWLEYGEVARRVERLARLLARRGVGPGDRVALCLDRSVQMELAVLGVLRSGAAYVPLDPSYPSDRLAFMAADSGCALVVTDRGHRHLAPAIAEVIDLDEVDLADDAPVDDLGPCPAPPGPEDVAYVIYTSGSTGRPKGVVVAHRGVANRLAWAQTAHPLDGRDTVLQKTPFSFDVSVWEMLWPLLVGSRLFLAAPGGHRDPRYLARTIGTRGITVTHFVPSMLDVFLDVVESGSLPTLRQVMVSGEALGEATRDRFFAVVGVALANLYGPTEASVDATWADQRDDPQALVTIGRPIANTTARVLGEGFRELPAGVPGELYLGGVGLADGYLGRPELTAERFVVHPVTGERLYRTGDLVRWLPHHEIHYLGRTDDQVKVRGMRVELGEIDGVLAAHPAVAAAATVLVHDHRAGPVLVAHIVPARGTGEFDPRTLTDWLRARLPAPLIPTRVVAIDALPLSPAGKLDRRALAAATPVAASLPALQPPESELELLVAQCWVEVLGIHDPGADDDFFSRGGHSLAAARLAAAVERATGLVVPLAAVFERPTIAGLAAHLLATRSGAGPDTPRPVALARTEGRFPLSPAQERMLFLEDLAGTGSLYGVRRVYRLRAAIDPGVLAAALADLTARHAALRTTIRRTPDGPVQELAATGAIPVRTVDLRAVIDPEAAAQADLAAQADTSFDLTDGPLARVTVYLLAAQESILLVHCSHLVVDATSLDVLGRELAALYDGHVGGPPAALAPVALQFPDVAVWQRETVTDPAGTAAIAYWVDALAGAPETTDLPTDRPRPAVRDHRGGRTVLALGVERTTAIAEFARHHGATPFAVLHAALATLLVRLSGQDDITVGTPVAGREFAEVAHTVGLFVNTVVLRSRPDLAAGFGEQVRATMRTVVGAQQHQSAPFESVVEAVAPRRDISRNPLFQVMINLAPGDEQDEVLLGGVPLEPVDVDGHKARFDLSFGFAVRAGELRLALDHSLDVFDDDTAARLARRYLQFLDDAIADPDRPVATLSVLLPEETATVRAWGRGDVRALPPRTTLDLVLDTAARTPTATAVVDDHGALDYAGLVARVQVLSTALLEAGAGPGDHVGVAVARSADLVVAALAVWAAGAAYVPLDPQFPEERLRSTVEDAGVEVVVGEPASIAGLDGHVRWLSIRSDPENPGDPAHPGDPSDPADPVPAEWAPVASTPGDAAYVIYTSGSTGRPKGVVVEHGGLLNLLLTMAERPGLAADDVLMAVTTFSFDIAMLELLLPLVVGATVVVASARTTADPHLLGRRLDDVGATVLQATPSTWRLLVQAGWPLHARVRAWCGGEPLGPELAAQVRPRVGSLWNLYGPTETTIWSTVDEVDAGSVTVGRPVANTVALVTDARGELLPPGVVGELVLGGDGVARGYWRRPELTAERFIDTDGAGRAYRTGDLARWRRDGRLDLLGRVDHQVKVRGHRIELGEIEAVLAEEPSVAEAVAVVLDRGEGDRRLVAYVVGSGAGTDPAALTAALRRRLPGYMVPSHVVVLDAMPRTGNLKIDRSRLPAPGHATDREVVAPVTDLERTVATVCAELLGVPEVSVLDDFFEIGGHSLLAATLVTRLSEHVGRPLALHAVFETPVLRDLAASFEVEGEHGVDRPGGAGDRDGRRLPAASVDDPTAVALALAARAPRPGGDVPVVDVLPVSAAQQRMWMLHALLPDAATYHVPLLRRIDGPLDVDRLARAMGRVVERHEILRTRYVQHGPTLAQVVEPAADVELEVVDLPLADGSGGVDLDDVLRGLAGRPFDLATGPVLRAAVVRVAAEVAYLVVTIHHVAADAGSLGVLLADLARAYDSPDGETSTPAVRYGDLAVAEVDRVTRRTDRLVADEQFWRENLAGVPTRTELPLDRPRPAVAGVQGGRRRRRINETLAAGVDAMARTAGGTPFMVVTAAVAALLARHGAGPDLVLGVPTAGRDFPGADEVVGPLINTVPVRVDTGGDPAFGALVDRVVTAAGAAFRHDSLPFEALLDLADVGHDRGTHPLFQVMVSGRREAAGETSLGAGVVTPVALDWGVARYDLTFTVDSVGADRAVALEYRADLFDPDTAHRLLDRLVRLLEQAVDDPSRPVGDFVLDDGPDAATLAALADARPLPSVHRSWPDAVRAIADREPDRLAVRSAPDRLTFGELVRAADALAEQLRAAGTAPGDIVALAIGHRVEWLVGVVAVWTLGAAYLAVDPTYPELRNRAAVEETGCRVLLRHADEHPPGLPAGCRAVEVDAAALLAAPRATTAPVGTDAGDLAYVVYTSGSTGRPKASLVEHGHLVALVHSLHAVLPEPGRTRLHAINAPLAFDASVQQLVHLAWGNALDLVPDDVRRDPRATVDYVRDHGVEVLDATPTHLRLLVREGLLERADFPSLLLVGGEAIEPDLWDTLRRWDGTALNCYGPTEVTVQATVADIASHDRPTLGSPLPGVRATVVDPQGRPVPLGTRGELWLGGPQVSRGYLDRETLTRERFVVDAAGGRWYRTGDIVRVDGAGRLQFRGRADDQVKVRGHRIELAEIDNAFAALPGVLAAAAVVVERDGDRDLAVHVVPTADAPRFDARALRQAVRDRLPLSMLPRWIVAAAEIPRTPAGKADRERLRQVDLAPWEPAATPRTVVVDDDDPAQLLVRSLWSEVLGHDDFDGRDDFFDVGGNSLLAIAVVAQLRRLDIDLPLTVMFDRPTVAGIAELVTRDLLGDAGPGDPPVGAAAGPAADGGRW